MRPHYWLSDEWFTPDGVPGVAIPFYLAHPRLAKLELAQMLEVEGGDRGDVPEDSAARGRARDRQRVPAPAAADAPAPVRPPDTPYPEYYTPKPYSKSFVQHLDHWYAQSHPDEDFAETFAVWLDPPSMWATRYAGWPAQRKLEYMDRLMRELARTRPTVKSKREVDPLPRLRKTLGEHYRKKREHYGLDHPDFYESDLRNLFSDAPEYAKNLSAARFVRRIRKEVAQHGGQLHRQLPVHDRSAAREDHRALPRAEPAADGLGRGDEERLHGVSHRPDDELPAQRPAPRGAMSSSKLRVLALVHRHLIPPDTIPEGTDLVSAPWRTEYDVITTLRAMGHEVQPLGVHDDLGDIRRAATEWKPHIAFNLLEGLRRCHDLRSERRQPPRAAEALLHGLQPARAAAGARQVAVEEAARLPPHPRCRSSRCSASAVPIRRPKRLPFPLIVKSLTQEASIGISQASVVDSDEKLKERVAFIHESIGTAAIVEQYIEGRELYVGDPRQPGAAGAAGLGAVLHQHAGRGASASRPTA